MESQITKYDLSRIRSITKGNSVVYNKMINIFITNSTKEFENINNALSNKDIVVVKSAIHKLKPSLQYLMLDDFSNEITTVKEKLEQDGNFEVAKSDFHILNELLSIINDNLQYEIDLE